MEHRLATEVHASPQEVWPLFMDVTRWPEMTKSIQAVHRADNGPLKIGSQAVVKQPRLPRARWTVTELVPFQYFLWETSSPGLVTTGGHYVEQAGNGAVITLTLRESGLLAPVVEGLLGRLSQRYLSMELEGFRRTAESERGAAD